MEATTCTSTSTSWYDHAHAEKRQLFLRSYQFSRKQTAAARIRRVLARIRRAIRVRLGVVRRKARRALVWSGLRRHLSACCGRRNGDFVVVPPAPEFIAAREWFGTPCRWAWDARGRTVGSQFAHKYVLGLVQT